MTSKEDSNQSKANYDKYRENDLVFSKIVGEDQLSLANRLFNSLMEGIMITDTSGIIKYINPAFSTITGYGEEVIGENPRILKSGEHDSSFYKKLWSSVEKTGQWKGEIWNRKKSGETYIQWSTITVVKDKSGKAIYYTAVISDITERKKEEEQLQNDLLLAREVQKAILSPPIMDENINIDGLNSPSALLGGDMYAWFKINDHQYGIFLMDVMGHGVGSSLVSMSIQSLLQGMITRLVNPERVLNELNKHVVALYRNNQSPTLKKYYLTGIYVVIDTRAKQIHYASAGHPPGFLIDEQGNIQELTIGSIPLGMLLEIEVPTEVLSYEGETKLVLYTDGLIENELVGTRENIESLKTFLAKNRHLDIKELLSIVFHSFPETNSSKEMKDDISIVGARFS